MRDYKPCKLCGTPIKWNYLKCRCANNEDYCDYCYNFAAPKQCCACMGTVPQTEQGICHDEYISQRSGGTDE